MAPVFLNREGVLVPDHTLTQRVCSSGSKKAIAQSYADITSRINHIASREFLSRVDIVLGSEAKAALEAPAE